MNMKKILFVTVLLFCVFILSSCDYPEKSFQALQRENIPKEVTRNFQLEKASMHLLSGLLTAMQF